MVVERSISLPISSRYTLARNGNGILWLIKRIIASANLPRNPIHWAS
jgi:hypothetical protein